MPLQLLRLSGDTRHSWPSCRSYSALMSGPTQVAVCTPLVMASISAAGAASRNDRPTPPHISLLTAPCSWLTPLRRAALRRASTVMEKRRSEEHTSELQSPYVISYA